MLLPIGYFVSIEAKSLFAHERLAGKKKEKKNAKKLQERSPGNGQPLYKSC